MLYFLTNKYAFSFKNVIIKVKKKNLFERDKIYNMDFLFK